MSALLRVYAGAPRGSSLDGRRGLRLSPLHAMHRAEQSSGPGSPLLAVPIVADLPYLPHQPQHYGESDSCSKDLHHAQEVHHGHPATLRHIRPVQVGALLVPAAADPDFDATHRIFLDLQLA